MYANDLFEEHVALVTGAGQGIGRSIAIRLAELGADLAVNDVDGDSAEETAATIRNLGKEAVAVQADVADPAEVEAMIDTATEELGPVRHAVNNAATKRYDELVDHGLNNWEFVLRVNLTGSMLVGREVARRLQDAGKTGSIANISSIEALRAQPGAGAYPVSKKAILSLTELMALEWAADGIRANAICPGMTWTEASEAVYSDDEIREGRLEYVPTDRIGQPEDIADAVVYTLAPGNDYLTGEHIVIDGGLQLIGLDRMPGQTERD